MANDVVEEITDPVDVVTQPDVEPQTIEPNPAIPEDAAPSNDDTSLSSSSETVTTSPVPDMQANEALASDSAATPEPEATASGIPEQALEPEHTLDDVYESLVTINDYNKSSVDLMLVHNSVSVTSLMVLAFIAGLLLAKIVWRKF